MAFSPSSNTSVYSDDEFHTSVLATLPAAAPTDTRTLSLLSEAPATPRTSRFSGDAGAMGLGAITQSTTTSDLSSVLPVWTRLQLPEHASSKSMSMGAVPTDLALSTSSSELVTTTEGPFTFSSDHVDIATPTAMDELEFTGDVGESGSLLDGEKLDGPQEVNRLNYIVARLPLSVTDKDLYDMFEPFGALQRATIIVGNESQSRGFGFVTFEEVADGERAMAAMHGKEMNGSPIRVLLSEHVYVPVVSAAVWVRNIPVHVTSDQLVTIFGTFGTLVSLHSQFKSNSSGGKRRNKIQIVRAEYESVAIAQTVIDALHGVQEVSSGLSEPLKLPLKLVVRFYSALCGKTRPNSAGGIIVAGVRVAPPTTQSVSPSTSASAPRSTGAKSSRASFNTANDIVTASSSLGGGTMGTPRTIGTPHMWSAEGAPRSDPPQYMPMMSAPQAVTGTMMPVSSPPMPVTSSMGVDGIPLPPVRFVHGMELTASPHATAFNAPPMMMSQAGPYTVQPQYYQTAMPLQAIPTQPQPQPQPQLVSYGSTLTPGMMQLAPMQQPVYTYLAYVESPQAGQMP